jgi:uncharacterized membrane-anchored protein YhcB (DUF1043 family)
MTPAAQMWRSVLVGLVVVVVLTALIVRVAT